MTRCFIGLGANLGDRRAALVRSLALLGSHVEVVSASSVYETAPMGPVQPDFYNAVAEIETSLPPQDLLSVLKRIEEEMGRIHRERWGPREIDLDLLLYGDLVLDTPALTVPHPGITERLFVMVPLLELDPNMELPSGEPLSAFCERDAASVTMVGPLKAYDA